MDKPPRLKSEIEKSDIELKVSDGVSDGEVSSSESATPSSATALSGPKQIENTVQAADERIKVQAGKRAKEQEFLKAYKAKQLNTRIRFVAFGAIAIAIGLSTINFVFRDNDKAASALRKFQIAPLFACLGERDIAHYTMTEFSDESTKNTPNLIETRTKILDNAISEMEKNGKPAIFTRLGTEQMLMKFGDRATGLKFGDALIARYPELPSNYFWRAKTDLEQTDYRNSVLEYKQAMEKLQNLPNGQKQDWHNQLSKGAWASIYSGQTPEAEKFLAFFQTHGGTPYEYQGLKSAILLNSCADLGAPMLKNTPYWNEKLGKEYQNRLDKAASIASKMSYSTANFDDTPEIFGYEIEYQAALLSLDPKKFTDYLDHNFDSESNWGKMLKAQEALGQNRPQEALNLVNQTKFRMGRYRREHAFVKASALQKLHRSEEAIELIDASLNRKPYDWDSEESDFDIDESGQLTASHFKVRFLMVKASALCDQGKYKQALALCESLLAQNPNLIELRLIKIRCYQGLKDATAASAESEIISSALAAWMNSGQSKTDD